MKIFIDLDGTLIDISNKYYQLYCDFMRRHNLPTLSKNEYWEMKRSKKSNADIIGDRQKADKFKVFFTESIEKKEYLELDTLFPFTLDVLSNLKLDFDIYLVTLRQNKTEALAEINKLGLQPFFKEIFINGPFPNAADNFELKIDILRNHVEPDDIIVGDTKADIKCGQVLGIKTIGVLSGISSKNVLELLQPDFLIPDIRKVRDCIQ